MRKRLGWFIGAALLAVGLAVLWFAGCEDNLTGSGQGKSGRPKDYVLYWAKYGDYGTDSTFFGYHLATRKIDTFFIPGTRIYDMKVSADGKRVFVSYAEKIRVLRALDFSPVYDIPYSGWYGVVPSPDNRHLAVQSGNLKILSASDFSLDFEDTITVYRGVFNVEGSRFYAPGPTAPCRSVYRLDLENGFSSECICVPDDYQIARVAPSVDEKYLFMFRSLGSCYYLFDVFDVAGDTLLFRDLVAPGCGDLAVAPNGRYVYFTGPGDMHGWPPPVYSFAQFSIAERSIDSTLLWTMCGYDFPIGLLGNNLVWIPGGRLLVVAESPPASRFIIYDCARDDTLASECLIGAGLYYLGCQQAP